jgi:hypothetical protein
MVTEQKNNIVTLSLINFPKARGRILGRFKCSTYFELTNNGDASLFKSVNLKRVIASKR